MQFHCKVCGRQVDPDKDILFGALGKPLFAAHAGDCADIVRTTTTSLGGLAVNLLKARQPKLHKGLVQGLDVARRFLAATQGGPEKSES